MSDAPLPAIHVELAGIEHLPEIAALAGIIWRTHYPGIISSAQIEYMLARMYDVKAMTRELEEGVVYERVLVGQELRGFSSYGPTASGTELKLHKLYIHPNAQRQGLAGMLLQRAEKAAQERGIRHVVLAVNKQNSKAIAAYRKHAFTIRESVMVAIGGGFVMDDYVMAKQVPPATR